MKIKLSLFLLSFVLIANSCSKDSMLPDTGKMSIGGSNLNLVFVASSINYQGHPALSLVGSTTDMKTQVTINFINQKKIDAKDYSFGLSVDGSGVSIEVVKSSITYSSGLVAGTANGKVTVTSNSNGTIKGTFSGELTQVSGGTDKIQVTDGSFNAAIINVSNYLSE